MCADPGPDDATPARVAVLVVLTASLFALFVLTVAIPRLAGCSWSRLRKDHITTAYRRYVAQVN